MTRRFCQLVLAVCQAVAVLLMDVLAGGMALRDGDDGIACRFFSFLVSGRRGDGVSSSRPVAGVSFLVPFLVLCSRPVCVFLIGVLVSALASRLSPRVDVPCRRVSPCRCCPVAPFLSARVPVLSRLVSSLLSFYSYSSSQACRMASGRCGVAAGRGVVVVVVVV